MLKSLDLRDPAIRAEYGLRTVSIPSQNKKRQEKRPAEQALQMIRDYVLDNPSCTRLDISRHLGRSKNGYVIGQIEWLVRTGQLARTEFTRPNGALEFRYVFIGDAADY